MSWFSASPPSQRWAYALTALVTATAVPLHAHAQQKRQKPNEADAPVMVGAEEITGRPEREINLERDV